MKKEFLFLKFCFSKIRDIELEIDKMEKVDTFPAGTSDADVHQSMLSGNKILKSEIEEIISEYIKTHA